MAESISPGRFEVEVDDETVSWKDFLKGMYHATRRYKAEPQVTEPLVKLTDSAEQALAQSQIHDIEK